MNFPSCFTPRIGEWFCQLPVRWCIGTVVLVFLCWGSQRAAAQTVNWTGNTSTDWNTGSNWSTSNIPGNGDIVAIDLNFSNQPNINAGNFTVSNITIGQTSIGGLTISNGGSLTDKFAVIGAQAGANGSVTVTGNDSTWINTGQVGVFLVPLIVGINGGTGNLTVSNGGEVSYGSVEIAGNSTILITDPGSVFTGQGGIYAGNGDRGSLIIANGAYAESAIGEIGDLVAGSNGTVDGQITVTGTSSKWVNSEIDVGSTGNGTLIISNGGEVDTTTTVSVAYGAYNNNPDPTSVQGNLIIDGAGSVLSAKMEYVGGSGQANVSITNAGKLLDDSTWTFMGYSAQSNGNIHVDGSNSTWIKSNGGVYVGYFGSGNLTISNGGAVTLNGDCILGGTSSLTVSNGASVTILGNLTIPGNNASLANQGHLRVGGSNGISGNTRGAINFSNGILQVIGSDLTVAVGANIAAGSQATIDTNGFNATWTGNIVGAGSLLLTGNGTITLSGNNTYSGSTTMSNETLILSSGQALQNSTLFYNTDSGALSFGSLNSLTLGGLSGNKDIALYNDASGNLAITIGTNNVDTTYSGNISGLGSLTKQGNGTLTLAGDNTFTGQTNLAGGTLKLGNTFALQNSLLNITSGSLDFGNLTSVNLAGLTGNQGITLNNGVGGAVVLSINGTNSNPVYNGSISGSGSIILTTSGNFNLAGNTTQFNGNILDNGALTFSSSSSSPYTGIISGNGTFTKTGSGNLILSGNNTYTGGTVLWNGTLTLASVNALGNPLCNLTVSGGNLNINGQNITVGMLSGNGGTITDLSSGNSTGSLTVNGTIDSTYRGQIKNVKFIKAGPNTFTNEFESYPTDIEIDAGTLNLTNGVDASIQTIHIVNNASLSLSALLGPNSTVSGTGGLILNNGGGLQGPVTYAGDTVINPGNESMINSISTLTGNIVQNGNLTLREYLDGTFNGSITGNGSMTFLIIPNTTLTLAGAVLYTGNTTVTGPDGTTLNFTTGFISTEGAIFKGFGNIGGNIIIDGTLVPARGPPPGLLTFNQNLTLGQNSTMQISIQGTTRATQYSAINVGGNLTLAGTLALTFLNGYAPGPGTSFNFFQVNGTTSGSFANVTLPTLDSNLTWNVTNLAANGTISADAIKYPQWVANAGLSGNDALTTAAPFGGPMNLIRYTMNLNLSPEPPGQPSFSIGSVSGGSHLFMEYRARKAMTDYQLVPQYSTDLENWTNVDAGSITQTTDADLYTAQYFANVPLPSNGPVFLRVVAQAAP